MAAEHPASAYLAPKTDRVREELEAHWLARRVNGLVPADSRVLDLGCGGGLGPLLAAGEYVGVDFRPPGFALPGEHVLHDLREGLGPVGADPFDLYVAGFGVASHLTPAQLRRLLEDVARHARPGSMVAIEALGLDSLEWPRLWHTQPGEARTLPYALDRDVLVHPWGATELLGQLELAGIAPLHALDRSLQTGPKIGEGRYWPGLPPLRRSFADLLGGRGSDAALVMPLPPLPAGRSATVHQRLAACRRALVAGHRGAPAELAHAIWGLEQGSGGGFGHGLLAIGRVP